MGKKVKFSRYRPRVAQRVGRIIALLFHDRGSRRGWVVSSTPRPHFTPGKDLVPILQETGWAPGSVWTGGKSRPHWDSIPDRPPVAQSLYRLHYPAHRTEWVANLFFFHILNITFLNRASFSWSRNLSIIVQDGVQPNDAFQRALSP